MKKLLFVLLFFYTAVQAQNNQNVPVTINATGGVPLTTANIPGLVPLTTVTVSNLATGQFFFTGITNVVQPAGYSLSVGVYDLSGNLLRTLTSAQPLTVQNNIQWDGKDDAGNVLAAGNYQIKYLTSNVQYTWEGGIGDSSTEPYTSNKLFGNTYTSLTVAGTKMYASYGYSENDFPLSQFNLSDINLRLPNASNSVTGNIGASCTDGNYIYLAADKNSDNIPYQSWIDAINPADNIDVNKFIAFAARQPVTSTSGSGNFTDNNAICYSSNASSYINSMAVQMTGNFLFVARAGLNQLQVLDKRQSSGYVLQTISLQNVSAVAADANSYLYVILNGTVKKYAVNGDGSLTDTGVSFTGLTSASKLTYSNELSNLAVFDNSTYQLKIYNPSGGNPIKVVGQSGGYSSGAFFDPNSVRFADASFIYYQADGSFWIGQDALFSVLHLNPDFTLKEESQHLPTTRSINSDQNNPTSVFCNWTEYERDYSKPLDNGSNGSWKFKANWNKGIGLGPYDNYNGFGSINTLSNGRRYARVYSNNSLNGFVCELTNAGLRNTGIDPGGYIARDGSVLTHGNNNSYGNQPIGIYKRTLTGFDSSNNPIWSAFTLLVADPPSTNYTGWNGYESARGYSIGSDRYIYFANGEGINDPTGGATVGYRLSAVNIATGKPIWQTARTTLYNYTGPYPSNGDFDIGNNFGHDKQHSETHQLVFGNDVFFNINGEFWADTEANYWNHFDATTGLLIGHFGTDGNLAKLLPGKPQMAGNAFSTQIVKVGNDDYIYHCDESVHAFVHSWKVSGLNTVNITTVPITVSTPITLAADPADMMAGIPFRSSGFYGGSSWTMVPAAYDNHTFGDAYPNWRVSTSVRTYSKSDIDVAWVSDGNANGTITRDLGANNTNNWTLSGSVMQDYYSNNDKTSFDIVDATGKTIVTFHGAYSGPEMVNNQPYISGTYNVRLEAFQFANFKITCTNGSLSFSYAGQPATTVSVYDNSASKLTPKYFRVRTSGSNNGSHSIGSLKGLRFVTGSNVAAP